MSEADRRRNDSVYHQEGDLIPHRLAEDLAKVTDHHDGKLTPVETEVVKYLAQGLTDQAVADALGRSFHTVRQHVKSAKAALGAKNRAHLVAEALRHNLIT